MEDKTDKTIEVARLVGEGSPIGKSLFSHHDVGKLVSIRPCKDNADGKTYLGLYVGDIALGFSSSHNPATKTMTIKWDWFNPAIFVFDLNKIVFGAESWWGPIESEADLKQITNQDIDNIWYVKALKQIESQAQEEGQS